MLPLLLGGKGAPTNRARLPVSHADSNPVRKAVRLVGSWMTLTAKPPTAARRRSAPRKMVAFLQRSFSLVCMPIPAPEAGSQKERNDRHYALRGGSPSGSPIPNAHSSLAIRAPRSATCSPMALVYSSTIPICALSVLVCSLTASIASTICEHRSSARFSLLATTSPNRSGGSRKRAAYLSNSSGRVMPTRVPLWRLRLVARDLIQRRRCVVFSYSSR